VRVRIYSDPKLGTSGIQDHGELIGLGSAIKKHQIKAESAGQ
jgi:hypothetical protein